MKGFARELLDENGKSMKQSMLFKCSIDMDKNRCLVACGSNINFTKYILYNPQVLWISADGLLISGYEIDLREKKYQEIYFSPS